MVVKLLLPFVWLETYLRYPTNTWASCRACAIFPARRDRHSRASTGRAHRTVQKRQLHHDAGYDPAVAEPMGFGPFGAPS